MLDRQADVPDEVPHEHKTCARHRAHSHSSSVSTLMSTVCCRLVVEVRRDQKCFAKQSSMISGPSGGCPDLGSHCVKWCEYVSPGCEILPLELRPRRVWTRMFIGWRRRRRRRDARFLRHSTGNRWLLVIVTNITELAHTMQRGRDGRRSVRLSTMGSTTSRNYS